jgi:hypothetical protein
MENEISYIQSLRKKKIFRIFAILLVVEQEEEKVE